MTRFRLWLQLSVLFILYLIFQLVSTYYPEILWFRSFGYESVWWRVFSAKLTVFLLTIFPTFIWLWINVRVAKRIASGTTSSGEPRFQTPWPTLNEILRQFSSRQPQSFTQQLPIRIIDLLTRVGLVIVSVLVALMMMGHWEELYSYFLQTPFGISDPIYKKELSFYFFTLPFIDHIRTWLMSLLFLGLAFASWVYFSRNILVYMFSSEVKNRYIKTHLFILLGLFFFGMASGSWLNMFDLLYSNRGVVFGAGYTDVVAQVWSYRIMTVLLGVQGLILMVYAFRDRLRLPFYFLGVLMVTGLLSGQIIPNIIQSYIVAPNELAKEMPYIKHNIAFTREAYGLSKLKEVEFPAKDNLTLKEINNNSNLVKNIRLWNREPLKQTFSQLQEIRLYYEFSEVDVDRYTIDGHLEQVMLSAREMDLTQLSSQAQTWINRHLVFTHGYGVVMTPVSRITPEGLPHFYIKDIPPTSTIPLNVEQPEIYFGERLDTYSIVNSNQQEFNYPKGNTNVYNQYSGEGGVQLNSFLRRAIYALKFSDLKILISSLIKSDSRIIYDRTIRTITRRLLPFVVFDRDPYLVVTDEGRLVWMLDGYSTSNRYPYSEPFHAGGVNYIRNSVKATVDAYSGKVQFYIADETDPVISTYAKLYPGVLQPFSEMPANLQAHIRYPKDFFQLQASIYKTYHMLDPQVFYNREDLWAIPQEIYGETEKQMSPYYTVSHLPGDDEDSFILMLPFTPTNKNNMIAWMSVKCDLNSYGDLTVFKFPKERTIYGPTQIESRIDQDTEISKSLTLWGQVGSRVIRGNMMVVPIGESLVYVEPIYLQATQSKLPELKRVVFAYRDNIVMAQDLPSAISEIFDGKYDASSRRVSSDAISSDVLKPSTRDQLINELVGEYSKLRGYAKDANWSSWGAQLERVERIINQLKN